MSEWTAICTLDDLTPDRGIAALVGDKQVALFRLSSGEIYAISHHDPYSGANVMARGLVGTRGGVPTVASPMYKQVFDLRTGESMDDPAVRLDIWQARVVDGVVELCPIPSAARV
ncbi:MAG: nitrite reductase small subunit NirD [Aeromicrobium sp.]